MLDSHFCLDFLDLFLDVTSVVWNCFRAGGSSRPLLGKMCFCTRPT